MFHNTKEIRSQLFVTGWTNRCQHDKLRKRDAVIAQLLSCPIFRVNETGYQHFKYHIHIHFSSMSVWDHVGMWFSITLHIIIRFSWNIGHSKNRWDIESERLMQKGQIDVRMIFFLMYVKKGFISIRRRAKIRRVFGFCRCQYTCQSRSCHAAEGGWPRSESGHPASGLVTNITMTS